MIKEVSVGFSRKRIGRGGRPRYTAYYVDARQRERSVGTFGTRKDADRAWQMVEVSFAAGRPTDPRRGRVSFSEYVEGAWFPNHVLEPSTRQSYHYVLAKHLLPAFGPMRISEILPAHVREWVTERVASGVSPATIRHAKIVLSAIFTTALNDLVIGLHPCRGVKSPSVPVKEYRILTPEEFDRLYHGLALPASQLLVEMLVESGLRWGEVTELRLRDIHRPSGIVTVSRGVVEVDPKFHPTGNRFLVKPYPKGRRSRRFKLSSQVLDSLWEHAETPPRSGRPGVRFRLLHRAAHASPAPGRHDAGYDGADRERPHLPAWDSQRLYGRAMPVCPLSPGVRGVPRCQARLGARQTSSAAGPRHRRTPALAVVPRHHLEARVCQGRHRSPGPPP